MEHHKNVLVSTHGKKLISKLLNVGEQSPQERLQEIFHYLQVDPIAARYCQPETGNNSFHVLFSSKEDLEFSLPVLQTLLNAAPIGLKRQNAAGFQPFHLYLMQPRVHAILIQTVLNHYPDAASFSDADGFLPLFYYVMREDADAEICKMLCKAYPQGPSTTNRSNSFPLHFAAKRRCPNSEILRILIRRNPSGASHINDFGMLPLHCICGSSTSVDGVRIIHEAFPQGAKVKDRQGRLPLHLAVLAVGKHQRQLVSLQDQMEQMQIMDESGVDEKLSFPIDRRVVQYLINAEPMGLITYNNFEALPVDTVLESAKPLKSKKRTVQIYGLYDDPTTARILLIAHKYYSEKALISFPLKYISHLQSLNWIARRDAMLISYQFEPIPGSEKWKSFKDFKAKLGHNDIVRKVGTIINKAKKLNDRSVEEFLAIIHGDDTFVPAHNHLAKLRRRGFLELIRQVILFI